MFWGGFTFNIASFGLLKVLNVSKTLRQNQDNLFQVLFQLFKCYVNEKQAKAEKTWDTLGLMKAKGEREDV